MTNISTAILISALPTLLTAIVAAKAPAALYRSLRKPAWAVPARAFGPVWLGLYITMTLAAVFVARKEGASTALVLYWTQLLLNAAWSWIFFGLRRPGLALVELGLLWITVASTAVAFYATSPGAGLLLAPYLVWLSLALALNFAILRLNPPGSRAWSKASSESRTP